jgi:small-conductance mechanosensitive channel
MGLPQGFDPRKALDPAAMERVMKAQAVARAQATAATTILIGTIVTLITSAFSFVAALAWNDAINNAINSLIPSANKTTVSVLRALAVTIIAVVAVVVLQRVAGRWAKRSAIAATAGEGSY